uniref:ADAM metallopeptidase domain 19 n=1 Tax=Latimeria chalumnae TaxID=7897 RepID=H3B5U6_LATCH
ELFAPSYTETYYTSAGIPQTTSPNQAEHCFYHGTVRGMEQSSVALSTCQGLRGLIVLSSNLSYLIEPLHETSDQHLIYRAEHLKLRKGSCGHQDKDPPSESWTAMFTNQLHSKSHRVSSRGVPFMKLVAITVLSITNGVEIGLCHFTGGQYLLALIDTLFLKFYRSLRIRIALVGLEVWTHTDKSDVSENPYSTLWSFLRWRQKLLASKKHDNAQLITGMAFHGTTIGMAPLLAMCSYYQSGGVNMDHSENAIGVAATMAHEMGHNFGMSHDVAGCCTTNAADGGCIMAAATGHPFPKVFNKCNENELQKYLKSGGGMCLFNMPDTKTLYGGQRCGNGYLEEGEECDCGEVEECISPCCNANNCTLKAGAECAHGVCCQDCKLKAPGTVCRDTSGSCDLPEYCTGSSEFCPSNYYQLDGTPCEEGEAYCYNGMCLTYEKQCLLLWGRGARAAPDICFEKVNVAGDPYGNCGKDMHGVYRKCEIRDAKCGKIQCQSSAKKPLESSTVAIDTTIKMEGGERIKCRGTHMYTSEKQEGDMLDPGLVMTGTKCGEKHVCFEGQCRNSLFLAADECVKNCNGRGVCNNNKNCHCEPGWAPPYCLKAGNGGSVDSGPVKSPGVGPLVAGVLIAILLLIVLCGAGIYLYLPKKEGHRQKEKSKTLEEDEQVNENASAQRAANGHSNPMFKLKGQERLQKLVKTIVPLVPPKPRVALSPGNYLDLNFQNKSTLEADDSQATKPSSLRASEVPQKGSSKPPRRRPPNRPPPPVP